MTANDQEPMFLRPVEAAALAELSTRAIYRAIQRGELRAVRLCSRLRIPSNPVVPVRKPPVGRARAVVPLAPETVEAIRDWLLRRRLARDATLVSVLAYAGLRPGEALALTWAHVRERTLLVESAVSLGTIEGTKTGRRRTVPLVGPLAQDLVEWRLHAGRPEAEALVFPGHDGEPWTPTAYRNWRRRIYTPAAQAAGIERPRPYDLRHSFVSLLIAEGHNIVEVARQAGHSPTMALDTYAHVFEEFDPTERVNAADRIRKAREELRFRAQQPTLFDVA